MLDTVKAWVRHSQRIAVLTGAGVSAESGVPTFRDAQTGYWAQFRPEDMATEAGFRAHPQRVWDWYQHRRDLLAGVSPNAGHRALADFQRSHPGRITLITQNVDGLHLRAGNTLARTFQIHGNVFYMRCSQECSEAVSPSPGGVRAKTREEHLTDSDRALLRCPLCGARSRPHILLFDESYNEHHYHFYSSLDTARQTALLIVVGTAGATNLPNQVAREVYQHDGVILDINIETNPFAQLAESSLQGFFLREPSAAALPALLAAMA